MTVSPARPSDALTRTQRLEMYYFARLARVLIVVIPVLVPRRFKGDLDQGEQVLIFHSGDQMAFAGTARIVSEADIERAATAIGPLIAQPVSR